jgi:Tol biopolymer transport system component
MQIVSRIAACSVLVSVISTLPASAQVTTRASVSANGAQSVHDSYGPAISADGRYVAFHSAAPNLVPDDTNNLQDVFLRDRHTGTIERVNLGPSGVQAQNGHSANPSVSADGRFVSFTSAATNLVAGDGNGAGDVFVRDRQTATTTRVSIAIGTGEANGPPAGGPGRSPVISADGRFVVFGSSASNLVTGDTNTADDVFMHDRQAGTTARLSVTPGGAEANGPSYPSSMTPDGRYVVFISNATNLHAADTVPDDDVYVRDVVGGTTTVVSVTSAGVKGNNFSREATISADGRFVVFLSTASNLGDDGGGDLFVRDRVSAVTSALNLFPPTAEQLTSPLLPTITGDGRFVCYTHLAVKPRFYQSVILFDRQTLAMQGVDVTPSGSPSEHANTLAPICAPNGDGTVIAFSSDAPTLVAGDTNNKSDVFIRTLPVVSTDKTTLAFTAVTNGSTFVSQTGPQSVQLTQHRDAPLAWSATSSHPWLHVTPVSGTGSNPLLVMVTSAAGLPASGTITGTISFTIGGGTITVPPITVSLTLVPQGTSSAPFGTVDTPTDHRVGVTGALPFTGWALDDLEVTRVSVCRDAFGAEVAPIDPNCGGAAEIFVGFAVFIDGARPDVAAAYAAYPQATRAGWGLMVLTNMLPNQGNGTYRFTMRAQDREGQWFVLGTRMMTCANDSATLPFGTIDTPLQGGVAAGANYVNFGWALTPQPKMIPFDGSTIHVLVDGVDVGTADYNHARPDIQALFPGFANTNGAVGFKILNTTALTNGLHTISWTATDNQGAIEGLGSRFFTVANGVSAVTAASTSASSRDVDVEAVRLDTTPLVGRRGWDLEAPFGLFGADARGVTVVRSEEVNRVELRLGEGDYSGYLRTPAGLKPLPIGSRLDAATNTFTWAPGVGFVGPYNFVFVRSANGHAVSRREVRIVLHPKGRGSVGPQVVIDAPRANAAVNQPFLIGGWAVDLDAAEGTGVTTLHAWAFPAAGGAPIFLGATAYGGSRPDVAAVHGGRFKDSGFNLIVQGLSAGDYELALFAWSTETMGFVAPRLVPVSVER